MNGNTANTGLTAADIRALRLADSVYASATPAYTEYGTGCDHDGELRCVFREKRDGRKHQPEYTYTVPVLSRITQYDHGEAMRRYTRCWANVGGSFREVWRSIGQFLRPGDAISLSWIAGNNCGNVEKVNYHTDEVRVCVRRGKQDYTFLLTVQTGPENTARMCQ